MNLFIIRFQRYNYKNILLFGRNFILNNNAYLQMQHNRNKIKVEFLASLIDHQTDEKFTT